MKNPITSLYMALAAGIVCFAPAYAQSQSAGQTERIDATGWRCGQVEYENYLRSKDPDFDKKRSEYDRVIQEGVERIGQAKLSGNPQPYAQYTIPVVFHVVYNTPSQNISEASIKNLMVQLNKDWSRTNADAGNTPPVWQSIAANMDIQFCLATKDPSGNPTNGIVRKQTSTAAFGGNADVQSASTGGDNPWDVNKYLNIWTCNFTGGLLGYGLMPPISSAYGTAIHYCTVDGSCPPFGLGRTLSHEIGHCFSLYHIWGDDNGACSGSDQVTDTPNQADATSGCPSGVRTDACTPSSPGNMYMNFLDYTDDACYNMFTTGQKNRCQSAISSYLMTLVNNAPLVCSPAAALDAGISIISPNGLACGTTFSPVVRLQNFGSSTLTSCTINYRIDANPNQTFNWTGSLTTGQSVNVTLPSVTTTPGSHTFTGSSSNPNSSTDGNTANDQSTSSFSISTGSQAIPLVEGIENSTFPPSGWTLSNPDNATTWARTTVAKKTGAACMWMDNNNYEANGQVDELTIPPINLSGATSASLTFQLAYQMYSDPSTYPNSDSLKVLVSTDCGVTWTKLYDKARTALITATPPFSPTQFVPNANDWRQEVVSLTSYASSATLIKFRHTTDYENSLYVDDINITGVIGINETDLDQYVTVFPNPSSGELFVNVSAMEMGPVDVKLYNLLGEVVSESSKDVHVPTKFKFNIADQPSGFYLVEVKTETGKASKKIMLVKNAKP